MDKEKILVVEDDQKWIDNYKRWLENEPLEFGIAYTAAEALDLLKTNYYALVILDLALHPTHGDDRTSEEVQKYLIKKREGTKHIIISANAEKEDVQLGAFEYKSYKIFFKEQFEDIVPFLKSIKEAINESKKTRPDFLKDAYEIFVGGHGNDPNIIEHKILTTFRPEDGITGWYLFTEAFFPSIAPIVFHKTRNEIAFVDSCILGLFWSRKLGKAISICISGKDTTEVACISSLNSWLGWKHSDPIKIANKGIQGYIFIEPDMKPDDFSF